MSEFRAVCVSVSVSVSVSVLVFEQGCDGVSMGCAAEEIYGIIESIKSNSKSNSEKNY